MSEEKREMETVSFSVPKPPEGFKIKRGVAFVFVEDEEGESQSTMTGVLSGAEAYPSVEESVGLAYAAVMRASMLLEEQVRRQGIVRLDEGGSEEIRVEPERGE